jgi:hypothetical protein
MQMTSITCSRRLSADGAAGRINLLRHRLPRAARRSSAVVWRRPGVFSRDCCATHWPIRMRWRFGGAAFGAALGSVVDVVRCSAFRPCRAGPSVR